MSSGIWKSRISEHARSLGRIKSPAKVAAARQNGAKGGMPLSDAQCAGCGKRLGVTNRSGFCSSNACRKVMRKKVA